MNRLKYSFLILVLGLFCTCSIIWSQDMSFISSGVDVDDSIFIPDFSYAGYHNGIKKIPEKHGTVVQASTFSVLADDNLDDTSALQEAINKASKLEGPVTLQLPTGKLIVSGILYIYIVIVYKYLFNKRIYIFKYYIIYINIIYIYCEFELKVQNSKT